ncbi:OmpA family protein [Thioclava sp. FR2]|uniref:OmpA family protein n=1 Tax=Thioclava sp. FR2 TaxID=3445780 RepID=UPI003EB78FFD
MAKHSWHVVAVTFLTGWHPAGANGAQLEMPAESKAVFQLTEPLASYTLPLGPFRDGGIPGKTLEGRVTKTAWKTENPIRSTMDLLVPLRDQLESQGFAVLFACESFECGGFDFRFATPVLPEPEMHIDLGDYRYLTAEKGEKAVTLLISRSSTAGFVQVIEVDATGVTNGAEPSSETASPALPQPIQTPFTAQTPTPSAEPLKGDKLLTGGSTILDGLEFPSGSTTLPDKTYPSLDELAGWLKSNPKLKIAVVGHTDASGGLDVNIAISKKRAGSVRQYLIEKHGVSAAQVEAEGAGYLAPIASNLTEEGRRANRRVEVMVTSTQFQP